MLLGPFNSEGHDDHRRMIEANLLGAMTVTEAFLDQLRDGGGDLVNLSSVAGRTWPGSDQRAFRDARLGPEAEAFGRAAAAALTGEVSAGSAGSKTAENR
jgi:NAD(P)-dependent dehydrogenase (short-subunit alcohol dehydrogenase family)